MNADWDRILGPLTVADDKEALGAKDISNLAEQAAQLGDIREARSAASSHRSQQELAEDNEYDAKSKGYTDLHEQVQTSLTLLTSLESFITSFQSDLSAVSGHISDLQGRSKVIEARLDNRKAVRVNLTSLLSNIVISPKLIATLLNTEPSEAWIEPVAELERVLLAVRSGPRISLRRDLDEVAEKLRLRVTSALRGFFIGLFTPYRTSLTPNLAVLQTIILGKYRSFYAFLQRHSARIAHEVQKYYISTAQWYYETGFRRYVRALERVQARSPVGDISAARVGEAASIAQLQHRNGSVAGLQLSRPSLDTDTALRVPESASNIVILAHMADDTALQSSPENLFRSISLVLADNASSEFDFVTSFFGRPDSIGAPHMTTDESKAFWSRQTRSGALSPDASYSRMSSIHDDDSASVISGDSNSGLPSDKARKEEKLRKQLGDNVWKQIYEPCMEYAKVFITTLLSQQSLPPVALLSMIRLNDSLYTNLIGEDGQGACPTASMETYLMGNRLQLWPAFQREMGTQIDSIKKLGESPSGMAGMFGVGRSPVMKDSVIASVSRKYAALFLAITELSTDRDDDMVYNTLLRMRSELQNLLKSQAARQGDPGKSSGYLRSQYSQIIAALTVASTSHPRTQTEIASWREALRKA